MSKNPTSRAVARGQHGLASFRWPKPLLALIVGALLWGSASAQYQYGYDPSAYTYGYAPGYDMSAFLYGVDPNAWLYGWYGQQMGYDMSGYMYGGYGMDYLGQMELLLQQSQGNLDQAQLQALEYQQQLSAQLQEYYRYFITIYREATGDMTSPDEVAFNYGYEIYCQQYPVDCQLAAQQAQQGQARMADQRAAFDAQNARWYEDQGAMAQANADWLNTTIWGVGDYSSGAGGATYQLPFAPAPGTTYQTPEGNPLVFDSSQNIWYQVGPDGSYTPLYSVP